MVSQIAQALDVHGLIIYLIGVTFIFGALVFANREDDRRDNIKRRRNLIDDFDRPNLGVVGL
jgi:hypothetical protein